jgi:Na+-translocating ferredoxin:NAD+ oxidoreductase subunit G
MVLAAVGLVAALILAGLDRITRDRITLEQDRRALAALTQVLPATSFNNELLGDWIDITIAGLERPARVYRARLDGQPAALIVDLTTSRGYSGDIRLLVAVTTDGTVIAVRVLEHRETPGLGDRIEERRSDWIRQFRDRRLGNPSPEQWAPDRRGGDFDTMTNATITASAVIDAVRLALEAVEAEGDGLWGGGD